MALLDESLLATGPLVVGATGGSGTRVVARILREAGLFTGSELNESEDAWKLGDYGDRWINLYAGSGGDPGEPAEMEMRAVLRAASPLTLRPAAAEPEQARRSALVVTPDRGGEIIVGR